MLLFIVIFILLIIILTFQILKKYKELNIDTILSNGNLIEQTLLKGEIYYKGKAKNKDNLSYLVYIRLESGEEVTVDNYDIYSSLTIGDIAIFNKNKYSYKNQKYSFYSICLGELEDIKLNETLEYIN